LPSSGGIYQYYQKSVSIFLAQYSGEEASRHCRALLLGWAGPALSGFFPFFCFFFVFLFFFSSTFRYMPFLFLFSLQK
jgi:hypothetical protein